MFIINVINTIFCAIILIVGIMAYGKFKNSLSLLIAIAFGLFGVSHVFELMGMVDKLETFLIVIRFIAYLIVVYAIIMSYMKNK